MMSARPLPVTATFKPKDYYERFHPGLIYRQCEANLSDDSAGSTESLTSILHHESYSESDEEEDCALTHETWAKLRCAPDDSRSEQSLEPSMPRWPPGGNKAITKEFLPAREALANGDFLQRNALAAGPGIYVQQGSRRRRLVAAAASSRPTPSVRQHSAPPSRSRKKVPAVERPSTPVKNPPEQSKSKEPASAEEEAPTKDTTADRERSLSDNEVSAEVSRSRTTVSGSLDRSRDSLAASDDLSPWEKWLLNKERQLRKKQRREQRKEAQKKAEEAAALREKQKKAEKEREKVQAWIEQKDKMRQKEQRRQEALSRAAKEKEAEEKAKIAAKAKEKFEEWYSNKLNCEEEAKNKQEEEERNKAIQKEERLKKAAEAYEKWLQAAKSRPPSSHFSFGFSDGKLTRYYDTSSNPSPSYVNPLPWCYPRTPRRHRKFKC